MSDTPRTDKESFFPHDSKYKVCDSDFARQLERELNAANDRIKRLKEQLMDSKNKHAVLVADVVLNEDRAERIKRLEEGGDEAICPLEYASRVRIWTKAKESQ